MNLVDRAKKIIVSPKTEWDVIAAEATPNQQLIVGYVLPLAAVSAVAAFIGQVLVGVSVPFLGTVKTGFLAGIVGLVFTLVMAVVMVFVVGFIADALAPSFGGQKNLPQAVKVAAYSYTPVWIVGILAILPALMPLIFLAWLYTVYLMYLGLPKLMKAPQEKAVLGRFPPAMAKIGVIGLTLLWVTGISIVMTRYGSFAILPRSFVIKLTAVVLLTIAVAYIHVLMPRAQKGDAAAMARMQTIGKMTGPLAIIAIIFAVITFG